MILITGANGFLGSWICKLLAKHDANWRGLINLDSNTNRFNKSELNNLIVSRSDSWGDVIRAIKPEVVISCDWSGVSNFDRNADHVQNNNVSRIEKLACASSESGVKRFISFGSQAENGPINIVAEEINYDQPTTKYGVAKVETRMLLEKIFADSETTFIWGRIFSTYGEMDNLNWLIPSMVKSFSLGREFNLTSGLQDWSFLHAYDFSKAIFGILNSPNAEGLFNIGSSQTIKIIDVANFIAKTMDSKSLLRIGSEKLRQDQVLLLKPNTKKLGAIGWSPEIEINEGLLSYINWYRNQSSNFKGINLSQFPR
jgi:nucleoside-diphosphate-sugar epimerase